MDMPVIEGKVIELGTTCNPNILTAYKVLKTFDIGVEAQKVGFDIHAKVISSEQQTENLQKLELSLLSQNIIAPLQVH